MVLSGLALSILGLFRYMRQATSVPSSRAHQHSATSVSPDMEVIALREDDRVERAQREIHAALLHNPVVAERSHTVRERELAMERGLEIQDRETHFMSSARAQAPMALRSTSSKRKLDDYEIGMAESSVSATSQVGEIYFIHACRMSCEMCAFASQERCLFLGRLLRGHKVAFGVWHPNPRHVCQESEALSLLLQVRARRETREDVQEGSVPESSGRERFEIGMLVGAAEAQPLDGESQMREEGGNAALDDDSTWEDEPNWNGTSLEEIGESSKEPPDKVEDSREEGSGLEEVSEDHGSSLQVVLGGPTMVVDFGSSPYEFTAASDLTNIPISSGSSAVGTVGLLSSAGVDIPFVEGTEVEPSEPGSNGGRDDDLTSSDVEVEGEAEVDDELFVKEMERDVGTGGQEESVRGGYGISGTGLMPRSGDSSASSSTSTTALSLAVGNSAGRINDERIERIDVSSGSPMETSPARIQFFVRTYGRTIVLHAHASDLVESVHQQILAKTGLPVSEQRLIFGRLQLQQDQTLESCHVVNDATLTLVARMRSTALPASWQLINDLVSTIRHMCAVGEQQQGLKLMHSQDCVRASVQEFLKMAVKSVPISEHMQVWIFLWYCRLGVLALLCSRIRLTQRNAGFSCDDSRMLYLQSAS
jgi:hypothetical protein